MNLTAISNAISKAEGISFRIDTQHSLGGGCINQAWHVSGDGRDYFIKTNLSSKLAMFEAEFAGLEEIHTSASIKVPRPVVCGTQDEVAYLVLDYVKLSNRGNCALMGEQLALMHKCTTDSFGWHRDNTIGSTPQLNEWKDNWTDFWCENRLQYQIELAAKKGINQKCIRLGEDLLGRLNSFFKSYQPQPSLLHGDLWNGNAAFDDQSNPVIFDPACYYGDRETDIAMTELFGGFSSGFYKAYNSIWKLDAGYHTRKNLYNLYHILNHYNLFGGPYAMQAERMLEQLLTEC